jgi:hypothetical protein
VNKPVKDKDGKITNKLSNMQKAVILKRSDWKNPIKQLIYLLEKCN